MIRLLEFIGSILLLIIISPIILIIAIISFLETRSPFFVQKRVGKNKQPFNLVKFRTMYKNTSSLPTHLVTASSITKTGAFLRKSKLDELPQLINVMLGQMSLVGPRPCLTTQEVLIKERDARDVFSVRPGITGIAQINHVDMSEPERLARYEALWIKKKSPRLYIYCIWSTLRGKGQGDKIQHEK